MTSPLTVLISSAGAGAPLIECFRDSARKLGLEIRVLAADPNPAMSAACRLADCSFLAPECTDAAFVPALLKICRDEGVTLLLPTADPGLLELSESRTTFEAVGTHVVVSDPPVVRLAHDKLETAKKFKGAGIAVPDTMALRDFIDDPERLSWPVIAKPLGGTSSVGLIKPRRLGELLNVDDPYIVQEMWRGREFTVNLYFSRDGRLKCAIPHWRIEVRNGAVFKARTERVPLLAAAADKVGTLLFGARGPLCFQAILAHGEAGAVFELNSRIGAGYPVAHHAGAEFTRWLLEEAAGLPLSASDDWREGMTMLRYDAAFFCET